MVLGVAQKCMVLGDTLKMHVFRGYLENAWFWDVPWKCLVLGDTLKTHGFGGYRGNVWF